MARQFFGLALLLFIALMSWDARADDQPAFDRVMKTQTLRCGYWNWAPLFSVDLKTGEKSGIFYEVTNYIGQSLGLKIEWTQEVGFSSFEQDLLTGKVDAVCAGVWPKAIRAKALEFSNPLFYIPLNIYVRADDHRFDGHVEKLNSLSVRFSGMEGIIQSDVPNEDFPNSKVITLSDTQSPSELFLMVETKKTDAFINDIFSAESYLKNNPGKLRALEIGRPIRYFGNTIGVAKGEQKLVNMINTALEEAQSAGVIEKIIRKYETVPGSLLRVAPPYIPAP